MVTVLASFHVCGTEPTSQALMINWCSLLSKLSPPCFHTSAWIPSPPGALPSFRPAIALAISAMVGISSRLVLVMRSGMLSRASWYMSPGMSSHNSLAVREGLHSIFWFQVNGSLLIGPPHFLQSTVEALHVVSVSSSLQLHCLPFPPVWHQFTGAFL